MKEIIVYEMSFKERLNYKEDIICIPFQKKYSMYVVCAKI